MEFKEYAEKIGFNEVEGLFIRKVDKFFIYLKDWQYMVLTIPSFYIPLNKEITKDELKRITQAALNNACASMTLSSKNDTLIISLPEGKKNEKFVEQCNEILNRVIKLLIIDGFEPANVCPVCKQEAEYGKFMDNYVPIHKECIVQVKDKLTKTVEAQKGFSPKYILSILLSLVGTIVGLLPGFLLAYYQHNYYFAGIVVFSPLLCVLAYYLLRCPSKKWFKIATAILPVIAMIVFNIFTLQFMSQAKLFSSEMGNYLISNKIVGLRRLIFTTILSFGGFGGIKFLNKFRPDYQKQLDSLN